MASNFSNFGFGSLARPGSGRPAEIKQPKVYDFTGGKTPVIPPEERSDLPDAEPRRSGAGLPQPDVVDCRRRR